MKCVLAATPPTHRNFNLAYGTPVHVSLSFGQVIFDWIDHHHAELAEEREYRGTDLQCDVAACKAERGPALRIQENFLGLLI